MSTIIVNYYYNLQFTIYNFTSDSMKVFYAIA